jgi:dUTPase
MKIAQMIFERYEDVDFIQVESLDESERGGK